MGTGLRYEPGERTGFKLRASFDGGLVVTFKVPSPATVGAIRRAHGDSLAAAGALVAECLASIESPAGGLWVDSQGRPMDLHNPEMQAALEVTTATAALEALQLGLPGQMARRLCEEAGVLPPPPVSKSGQILDSFAWGGSALRIVQPLAEVAPSPSGPETRRALAGLIRHGDFKAALAARRLLTQAAFLLLAFYARLLLRPLFLPPITPAYPLAATGGEWLPPPGLLPHRGVLCLAAPNGPGAAGADAGGLAFV